MKTLFLMKEVLGLKIEQLGELVTTFKLKEGVWRQDDVDLALADLAENPKWYSLFSTMDIKVDLAVCPMHPTFRMATIEDLRYVWARRNLGEFLKNAHLFANPMRSGATYSLIQTRYREIMRTYENEENSKWDKHKTRLAMMVATAYWNKDNRVKYLARINEFKAKLEPIMCTQFMELGRQATPKNDWLDMTDMSAYTETIDFWRGLLAQEGFSLIGKEVWKMDKKVEKQTRFTYVSLAAPARDCYGRFLLRSNSTLVKMQSGALVTDNFREDSTVPSLEKMISTGIENLVTQSRDDLLYERRPVYYISDGTTSQNVNDIIPFVSYNIPYFPLFLAGLIDKLQVVRDTGLGITPKRMHYQLLPLALALSELTRPNGQLDLDNATPLAKRVFKNLLMYSSFSVSSDGFTKSEGRQLEAMSSWLSSLLEWAETQIPEGFILTLPVTRDSDYGEQILSNCNVNTLADFYDIKIQNSALYDLQNVDSFFEEAKKDLLNGNLIGGLLLAASTYFEIGVAERATTGNEIQFPRSTSWRGPARYLRSDFSQLETNLTGSSKRVLKVRKNKREYEKVTLAFHISPNIYYARDYHLNLLIKSMLVDLMNAYDRLIIERNKKHIREDFLMLLDSIGQQLKNRNVTILGSTKDEKGGRYHDFYCGVAIGTWYVNFILNTNIFRDMKDMTADIVPDDYRECVSKIAGRPM